MKKNNKKREKALRKKVVETIKFAKEAKAECANVRKQNEELSAENAKLKKAVKHSVEALVSSCKVNSLNDKIIDEYKELTTMLKHKAATLEKISKVKSVCILTMLAVPIVSLAVILIFK